MVFMLCRRQHKIDAKDIKLISNLGAMIEKPLLFEHRVCWLLCSPLYLERHSIVISYVHICFPMAFIISVC